MKKSSNFRNRFLRIYDLLTGSNIKNILNDIDAHHSNYNETATKSRLDLILKHAKKTVPYYKNAETIDIKSFPVVNKQTIKNSIAQFTSQNYNRSKLISGTTSGSTGTPFKFYFDKRKKRRRTTEVIYYNGWANYRIGDKHLLNAVGIKKSKLKLFIQNEIISNPKNIDTNWLEWQRKILKDKKIYIYIGYASCLKEFAIYCNEQGDKPEDFKLKGIITGSEKLDPKARNIAEKVFGCPVLSRYSSLETGIIAHECPEEKTFHLNTSSYFVEILHPTKDEPVKVGEIGRVVITDLFNYGMPLIRYDIGDLAAFSQAECSCGRKGPCLSQIEGRIVENVTDTNGELVSWVAINDIMWPFNDVVFFQFIQKNANKYVMKIQAKPNNNLETDVKSKLQSLVGLDSILEIEFVDDIPALPSGKRPYIINEHLKNERN
ncbi:MAG: hypothetical protein RBR97_13375 [Bacteroidales bacterium]|nr:hypothetical protein [Bacteroidales bacterium]